MTGQATPEQRFVYGWKTGYGFSHGRPRVSISPTQARWLSIHKHVPDFAYLPADQLRPDGIVWVDGTEHREDSFEGALLVVLASWKRTYPEKVARQAQQILLEQWIQLEGLHERLARYAPVSTRPYRKLVVPVFARQMGPWCDNCGVGYPAVMQQRRNLCDDCLRSERSHLTRQKPVEAPAQIVL